ncbi:SDR family NAD(P)-dependent oxidoreductase [Candidatus Epulonipiscium viviparus]|uniref:SDR family NAD(P)-dependent oxidoreductase n=1 Tax=Candidatus Epulonipiscium viviparus TaxID=420336 RepID=UPI00016C0F33|nr:SDR family NAD(P)-dependent oxidoreductase [Candidatus Epulopiscium viviparus]
MQEYALITGASSGIGAAMAIKLAKEGYNIIALGRNTKKLDDLAYLIVNTFELDVLTYKVDLTSEEEVDRLLHKLAPLHKNITFFMNNAGVGYFGSFSVASKMADENIINVNITASTIFLKKVLPLLHQNAHILMVASTAAFAPGPYMATYYASKAYILSLGLALRAEGLRVSVLAPGPTKTNFQSRANLKKSTIANLTAMHPARVASAAYNGTLQDKALIIPGLINKICTIILAVIPYHLKGQATKLTQNTK